MADISGRQSPRLSSTLLMANFGLQYVFAVFAGVLVVGAIVTGLFAVETKDRVLEELSP